MIDFCEFKRKRKQFDAQAMEAAIGFIEVLIVSSLANDGLASEFRLTQENYRVICDLLATTYKVDDKLIFVGYRNEKAWRLTCAVPTEPEPRTL